MNKPVSLVIVAWIYIAAGLLAGLDILIGLFSGRIHINLGALCLFAGIGLIRLQNGWRICALVFIWLFLRLSDCSFCSAFLARNQSVLRYFQMFQMPLIVQLSFC